MGILFEDVLDLGKKYSSNKLKKQTIKQIKINMQQKCGEQQSKELNYSSFTEINK